MSQYPTLCLFFYTLRKRFGVNVYSNIFVTVSVFLRLKKGLGVTDVVNMLTRRTFLMWLTSSVLQTGYGVNGNAVNKV